jgi:D-beta-D-heptose 7-phosphate kinase/D-beta-D-heptose 1-phosphate adenosyltransferase
MHLPILNPSSPPRVLVVGDLMVDKYLWGTCDRVSPEAPVQVVNIRRESYTLGGAGNVVANLRSLGAQVEIVALVGHDIDQTPVHRLLIDTGVSTAGLVHDETRPTTVKTRVLAGQHQIVRFDLESTTPCARAQEEQVIDAAIKRIANSDVVIVSDYGKGLLTPAVVRKIIEHCRAKEVPVLIDPKGRDYTKYRGASLLTPNRKEAAAASNLNLDTEEGISTAGRKLVEEYQLAGCLITLSEDGMTLFTSDDEHRLPTAAQEVFDVTGAGDTVIAAVAFGIGTGLALLDACRFANRAAGVVVGKLGSATVTLQELRKPISASSSPPTTKAVEIEGLLLEVQRLRANGRRIVFTNGCFDILHAGHVDYLTRAASLGDALIVGLNSDESVRRIKGPQRPINNQQDRAQLLAAMSAVTYVVTFSEDTPASLIARILPDVLVKGGDYVADDIVGADVVRRAGGSVRVLQFVEGKSTTAIIERAAGAKR